MKVDYERFRKLLLDLVDGKGQDRQYFEYYLAHIFQYPELQTPIALVFQGKGGKGKSKFWKFISKLTDTEKRRGKSRERRRERHSCTNSKDCAVFNFLHMNIYSSNLVRNIKCEFA